MSRDDLVTVGGVSLILFTAIGIAAVLLVYWYDETGNESRGTRRGMVAFVGAQTIAAVWLSGVGPSTKAWLTSLIVIAVLLVQYLIKGAYPTKDELECHRRKREAVKMAQLIAPLITTGVAGKTAEVEPLKGAFQAPGERPAQFEERSLRHLPSHIDYSVRLAISKPIVRGSLRAATALAVALVLWRVERWLLVPYLVAIALALGVLAAARASDPLKFFWTGVAVFIAACTFGGILSYIRTRLAPKVQPAAVLRKGDADGIAGLYITQTEDRLYLGRVTSTSGTSGGRPQAAASSGRMFAIKNDEVLAVSVGALQNIELANRRAEKMVVELREDLPNLSGTAPAGP